MSRFTFPYPVKPWLQTQAWGVANPAYEKFGFSRHNGTDIALGFDKLIRAPFAGTVIRAATPANGQWQPNGGGIFVSVLSDEQFTFDDGMSCYVLADFLHCDHLLVTEGQHVTLGVPLAVADNTGFSTGPHTHIQLRRETKLPAPAGAASSYRLLSESVWLQDVDKNDANNSFDPTPYYTKTYAIDDALSPIQKVLAAAITFLSSLKGRP